MKNKFLAIAALSLLASNIAFAQGGAGYFRTEVAQVDGTKVETRIYTTTNSVNRVTLTNGKRVYEVGRGQFGDLKIEGSIALPKKNDPDSEKLSYTGSFEGKPYGSGRIGLRADFIQVIPGLGVVGVKLPINSSEREQYKKGKIDIALGVVVWQLDPASGEVKPVESDELVLYGPYHRVFAKRLLYIKKGPITAGQGSSEQTFGYFFEDHKLVKEWGNLSVMAPPRSLGFKKPEVPRYYRYLDGYVQLAEKKMGEAYEVVVFDNQLQEKNTYFPSLLVYRNYDKMPNSPTYGPGYKLVADYRTSKGIGVDKLFHRQVLVPSQDIEGLYGVLQADGTVAYPQGSLGLSPVITEEVDAGSKTGETYLLSHFFLVAYPGGNDGKMNYAVAGPEGNLSFGSAQEPVWTEFMIYESEVIKKNNGSIYVHPELLVARLPDGNWQCYLVSRYNNNAFSRYENLSFYFPTPLGNAEKAEHEAIASVESILVSLNSSTEKYNAEVLARNQAESKLRWEKHQAEMERRRAEQAKANPLPQPSRGGAYSPSKWQGFTYTRETTSRYNQSVNQSNYNNSMRQYNNYLNSRIYRRY
jgi:hypothetical protein